MAINNMENKFYITTPIYYVNDRPHIGHAYTTVAADVLARYHRLINDEVFFLTGTDEHGKKVFDSAIKAGKSPQEFTDEVAADFQDVWKTLNISNDFFIRTTADEHKKRVQEIFTKLKEAKTPLGNDVLYEGEYKGLYCTGCERFLTEKELVDGKCPDHKVAPEQIAEKNYFFRLTDFLPKIQKRIENDDLKILPAKRKAEVLGLFKQGLDDFSVSRESVSWGVDLPFDTTQKAYVWVDALSNYITALGYPPYAKATGGKPDDSEKFKTFWPADLQLMAQDILKFHAIYWPAILLALGVELPKAEFIHGFFTINGQKMSKSVGKVIDPRDLVKKYTVDVTRYLLLSQFSFGSEADVQEERFDEKYNADLANGLGNLVARVSNLLEKDNIEVNIKIGSDEELKKHFDNVLKEFKIDEGLKLLWDKLRKADEIISAKKPWEIKDLNEKKAVLEPIAQDILNVAELLQVYIPETAAKIIKQFSEKNIKKGELLFPRI
ncbi:MAG: methionine--tRNA ligase [bacterium]|nr:methionine--tRNA ligase [bacterium]